MTEHFKIIVAGGRKFFDYPLLKKEVTKIAKKCEKKGLMIEIVSGGAKGADYLGEKLAKKKGFRVKKFEAEWDKHGNSAGMIRNFKMAQYANILIAFWDGKSRGTGNMITQMKKVDKPVRVIRY